VDTPDEGTELDRRWVEVGNNVSGIVRGCRDASTVADRFVRAGWRSRSSSWHGYELETAWSQVEIDPIESSEVLLNGVVDPERYDELGALLHRSGFDFSLELYDGDGTLIREIRA
jgi:hypothetical protein